jgi:phosphoribosyl 1,2-cyclic phosphodiesterase
VEVHSLASGSSGNSYLIKNGNQAVLLDAGLSGKRTLAALEKIGANPSSISAILVTHEHNDHVAGAGIISRRLSLPIYMTPGTWKGSGGKLGKIPDDHIKLVDPDVSFVLGDLEITPIPVCHDAWEPVNYVFNTGKRRAVVLTDTGCVTGAMLKVLAQCDAMVLEANHDLEMLQTGPYPWSLKQRVSGKNGHLSNLQAARLAAWLVINGKIKQVHLGHLSAVNNSPVVALTAVLNYLAGKGLAAERVYNSLQVLPRHETGPVLQVK